MSQLLFGLALISAALQTAWALIADGQSLVLPVVAEILYVGWRKVRGGFDISREPQL